MLLNLQLLRCLVHPQWLCSQPSCLLNLSPRPRVTWRILSGVISPGAMFFCHGLSSNYRFISFDLDGGRSSTERSPFVNKIYILLLFSRKGVKFITERIWSSFVVSFTHLFSFSFKPILCLWVSRAAVPLQTRCYYQQLRDTEERAHFY